MIDSEYEGLKALFVTEEYYANEEKDTNGNIKPTVEPKTRSVTVKIGRTIYDEPIFNSFAYIEIATIDNNVNSFDIKNWNSLREIKIEKYDLLNENYVKSKINERYNEKTSITVSNIQIENIMTGFSMNEYGDLLPSFVHFAEVSYLEDGKEIKDKISKMEVIE